MHKERSNKFGAQIDLVPRTWGACVDTGIWTGPSAGATGTPIRGKQEIEEVLPRGHRRTASRGRCDGGARRNRSLPLEGLKSVVNI